MSKFICSIVNRSFSFLRHVYLQHTFFWLKVVFINFRLTYNSAALAQRKNTA